MSEQDRSIAKGNSWTKEHIYRAIGHPYVFLEDSDIPVEIVEGKPELHVTTLNDGSFALTAIPQSADEYVIAKETNTRYKVYKLTQPIFASSSQALHYKIIRANSGIYFNSSS